MHSSGDDSPDSSESSDYSFTFPNHHHDYEFNQGSNNGHGPKREIINSTADVKYSSWLFHAPLFLQWTPVHHFYYQLSQFCLLLLLIMNLNKRQRCLVVGYSVFHCLWGWFVLRSVDVFVWGIVLAVFNVLSAVWAVCSDWPLRFRAENEMVYKKLFKPLKVSRRQFKRVLDCKRNIKILHAGDHYAIEKCTRVDSLALLISGRLLVSQNSKPLHVIGTLQFVDSPEYFGVSTDELFQVTITALEDTKLIVWHRDKLRLTIMNDEFLRIIFDHVIGRDVVRKLIQVSDTVTTVNGTAHLFSKDSFEEHYMNENEPMLERKIVKELYYRQRAGNNNSTEIWSLTKIDEETPV